MAGREEPQGKRLPVRMRTKIEGTCDLESGSLHGYWRFQVLCLLITGSMGRQEQEKQTGQDSSIHGMMRKMQRLKAKAGLLAYVLLDGVLFGLLGRRMCRLRTGITAYYLLALLDLLNCCISCFEVIVQ